MVALAHYADLLQQFAVVFFVVVAGATVIGCYRRPSVPPLPCSHFVCFCPREAALSFLPPSLLFPSCMPKLSLPTFLLLHFLCHIFCAAASYSQPGEEKKMREGEWRGEPTSSARLLERVGTEEREWKRRFHELSSSSSPPSLPCQSSGEEARMGRDSPGLPKKGSL